MVFGCLVLWEINPPVIDVSQEFCKRTPTDEYRSQQLVIFILKNNILISMNNSSQSFGQ